MGAVGGLGPQPGSWGVATWFTGARGTTCPGSSHSSGPAGGGGGGQGDGTAVIIQDTATFWAGPQPRGAQSQGPALDLCPLQLRGRGVSWGGRSGSQGNPDVAEKVTSTAPGSDQMWGCGWGQGCCLGPGDRNMPGASPQEGGLSHLQAGTGRGWPHSGRVVGEGGAAQGHFGAWMASGPWAPGSTGGVIVPPEAFGSIGDMLGLPGWGGHCQHLAGGCQMRVLLRGTVRPHGPAGRGVQVRGLAGDAEGHVSGTEGWCSATQAGVSSRLRGTAQGGVEGGQGPGNPRA